MYCSPTRPNPIPAAIRSMAGIIAAPAACRVETSAIAAIAAIAAAVNPMPASTHARAPQRLSRRGTSMENTMSETARGSIIRPAPNGPMPDRSCSAKVNSRNEVESPPLSSIVVRLAATRVRLAKKRSGSRG
jgi:hypothetical protein